MQQWNNLRPDWEWTWILMPVMPAMIDKPSRELDGKMSIRSSGKCTVTMCTTKFRTVAPIRRGNVSARGNPAPLSSASHIVRSTRPSSCWASCKNISRAPIRYWKHSPLQLWCSSTTVGPVNDAPAYQACSVFLLGFRWFCLTNHHWCLANALCLRSLLRLDSERIVTTKEVATTVKSTRRSCTSSHQKYPVAPGNPTLCQDK